MAFMREARAKLDVRGACIDTFGRVLLRDDGGDIFVAGGGKQE
jgi:hypothetical protein